MQIIFIRHGKTDWNSDMICLGEQDLSLNIIGIKQIDQISTKLITIIKNLEIIILVSPLKRAQETAMYIKNNLQGYYKIIDIITIPELKERSYYDHNIQTNEEFIIQVDLAWSKIENYYYNKAEQIIVISHKNILESIIKEKFNQSLSFDFADLYILDCW